MRKLKDSVAFRMRWWWGRGWRNAKGRVQLRAQIAYKNKTVLGKEL
jgi:hypothetical protein